MRHLACFDGSGLTWTQPAWLVCNRVDLQQGFLRYLLRISFSFGALCCVLTHARQGAS